MVPERAEAARKPAPGHRRAIAGLALAGGLGAGCVYLWAFSPHESGSLYPPCPTKLVTGFDCPGCGALRMGHDLLRGDLAAAAHDNLFLLVLLPIAAAWGAWFWLQRRRGRRPSLPVRSLITVVVIAVVWGVVRNLPGFPLIPGG
ncbi:DUF2752 domain-containing protein [Hoyosella subflava]